MTKNQLYSLIPETVNGMELSPYKSFWGLALASGQVLNFKTDLNFAISGFQGAGMAPLQNVTTPLGIRGGSVYQRTILNDRQIALAGVIQAESLLKLYSLKKKLMSYLLPDTSTQTAAPISLRFQLTDLNGNAIGNMLDIPVKYVGGLEGNTDNPNAEALALVFEELQPNNIKELTTNTAALATTRTPAASTIQVRGSDGDWSSSPPITTNFINALFYDKNGDLWGGENAQVKKYTGSVVSQATNNTVYCIAQAANGDIYVGGLFTTPQSYIMKYNGSTWSAVGTAGAFNCSVNGLAFGPDGKLYAVGGFTTPGKYAAVWNGSTWSALTGGSGLGAPGAGCIVRGLDGNMYIGGNFTTADTLTVNRVVRYNTSTQAYEALGSGFNNQVSALAVGPSGFLYAAGSFTLSGSTTVQAVGVFAGNTWQQLGQGLSGAAQALAFDSAGTLYVGGAAFQIAGTSLIASTTALAQYRGGYWNYVETYSPNVATSVIIGPSGKQLAVGYTATTDITYLPGDTTLTNGGTAYAKPVLTISAVGASGSNLIVPSIQNLTTGRIVYLDYVLSVGETLTLDFDALTFTSNFAGSILTRIRPGSDLVNFQLAPGTNKLAVLSRNSTITAFISYRNTHASVEGGVA